MKKSNHDSYNIDELIDRWKKFSITDNDLLNYGASGDLQFSIWITAENRFESIIISSYEKKKGKREWGEGPLEEVLWKKGAFDKVQMYPGERKLYRVSKKTIIQLVNSQSPQKVRPLLLPHCENYQTCERLIGQCEDSCFVSWYVFLDTAHPSYSSGVPEIRDYETYEVDYPPGYQIKYNDLLDITKQNLVVAGDEVKRFEKEFFIQEKSANTPEVDCPNNSSVKQKQWPGKPVERWEDISITLVAFDTVRVKTPYETKRLSYHGLNMQDDRKGDSPRLLWTTLMTFSICYGIFPHRDSGKSLDGFIEKFQIRTKELNRHMKNFFGIEESIFKRHYRTAYKNQWETKIRFSHELDGDIEAILKEIAQGKTSFFEDEVDDTMRRSNLTETDLHEDSSLKK